MYEDYWAETEEMNDDDMDEGHRHRLHRHRPLRWCTRALGSHHRKQHSRQRVAATHCLLEGLPRIWDRPSDRPSSVFFPEAWAGTDARDLPILWRYFDT